MSDTWRMRVAGKAWPNVSQHQASLGRMANFALGSIYGAGVGPKDLARRAISTLPAKEGSNKELAAASVAVMKFIGDNFNKYLGTLEPEDFAQRPSHTGSEPSPVLLEALTHEDPKYNGGIKFPETLDMLERNGVMTKQDFFKLANLQAVCDQEIAGLATQLEGANTVPVRSEIRDRMVDANCDSVGTLLCAFAHMFKPNEAINNTENVTMDTLREEFPMQFEVGRAWQYSYGSVACVNRIVREQNGAADQPDPVIAELERMGEYTPKFMDELRDVMSAQTDKTAVPMQELPQALQTAINTVGARANEHIDSIDGASKVRKAIYRNINNMNAEISVCNSGARNYFAKLSPESSLSR